MRASSGASSWKEVAAGARYLVELSPEAAFTDPRSDVVTEARVTFATPGPFLVSVQTDTVVLLMPTLASASPPRSCPC